MVNKHLRFLDFLLACINIYMIVNSYWHDCSPSVQWVTRQLKWYGEQESSLYCQILLVTILNVISVIITIIVFLCIIYCVTNAVAVMYSRNIPMAEKRIVCFQSKKWKYVGFFSNNYYIYLKRNFEIFVTNDFCSIFWRTAPLTLITHTHAITHARTHAQTHTQYIYS